MYTKGLNPFSCLNCPPKKLRVQKAEWHRQEAGGGAAPGVLRDRWSGGQACSATPCPLRPRAEGLCGPEGLGIRKRAGGSSYQEAVVLGVGGQAQAETHVVLPLGHVGQGDPSWGGMERLSLQSLPPAVRPASAAAAGRQRAPRQRQAGSSPILLAPLNPSFICRSVSPSWFTKALPEGRLITSSQLGVK